MHLVFPVETTLTIGTQVTTWGYPGGYFGASPLLGVGYLAGVDSFQNDDKSIVTRWVVNAAFNHGNSGGPLIDESSGEVIGVVISKLAPLSENTKQIMSLLSKEQTGVVFNFKQKDGKTASVSEASLVESVLSDLSSQVQLVVGYAALTADLTGFLKKNGLDP